MLDSIGKYVFLKVPENDRDRALTVRVFNCVSASIMAFLIVGGIGAIFVFVRKTGSLTIVIMLSLFLIIALWIAHRGKIRHAAMGLICGLWAASTVNVWLSGTVNTVFVGMYIAVIAVAGVLIGSRFAVIIASMSIASAFGLSLLQSVGYTWPSYYPMPPWSALLVLLFTVVLIVPAITGMVEAFTEASSQATQEIERRRRTEEILGESEERYRFLFERSGNAVAVYKPVNDGEDFIFVDFNKAGEQMEQISREKLIGKSVLQLFPGVKELGLFDVLQRVWRTGEPEHHPVGHYEDDRIRGWRDNFVYRLPSGEIVAVYSDETERKLAEEALRSSEKAYRTLAQNIPGIVYRVHFGDQPTMEFFNNEVESITGFSEKELRIGEVCSIDPLILSEDRPKVVELVKQAFSKNTPFEIEYRIRDKNGAIRHLLEYGRPVSASAGSPSFIDGVIFDISARKKAQEQIEGQASLMESLLEAIPAPVFYKDTDHVYIGCNEAFSEFIGLPKANIIGKSVFDVAPKELAEVYRTQDEALFNNPVTQVYEASVKSSNGTTHDVMLHKATFADSSGAVAGLIGVILDITERKKAEEALIESESRVRGKLDAIMSPEGDIGTLELADVIDAREVQAIMDDFYALTNIGVGIIDLKGKVLVATGWQDICSRFHRVHPEAGRNCLESDTQLCSGIAEGALRLYRCLNNMWDIATPIIVGGKHLGNLFLGQFLFEEESPDYEIFRAQARQYGFDEREYLAALDRVPRWSRETVDTVMRFYSRMTLILSRLSFSNIKLSRIIAEREDLVNSLRESEQRYRLLADNTLDVIWQTDCELRFTYVNPAIFPMTGHTPEEWVGTKLTEHCDEENFIKMAQKASEEISKGADSSGTIFEAVILKKNKEPISVEIHGKVIFGEDGLPTGLQGVTRDITDRKKAEEELRESEEKYRTVVEESFDGVFVQKGALIAFGNSRLYEMLGYNKRELEGLDHWLIYHPDYQDITRARARARLAGESVPPRYEVNLLRKDGTSFPGEINAKVILLEKEPQIQVWVRDLTEQKRLEKRLVEAQKMEAVGTLAGGIAHDFNNLLHIISGHAELLEMELSGRDLKFGEMDAVLQAANRGAELVKQLLTFGRKVDTKFKSINLNEDVRNTERLLYRTIPKMIEIELRLDEDLQPVRADSTQVEQMLINLAVNAKDAMPEGGKLTIETKEVLLDEGYWRDHPELIPGRYVLLRVSDTGHGMEEDVLQHIFEPFFTTKGLADGTGLGLATVFGIVKMHGGHISCESEVGKGTTFSIYLPVAEAAKSEVEQGQAVSSAAGGTENILMVDDEPLIRDLAKRILERAGYSVIAACSGREAIEIYAQHKSDIALVILDLIMPEMGGKQCLEELLKINPQVKALIASGFAFKGETKSFLDSEAKGTVSKPFNMRELLSAVRHVLDG